MKMAKKAQGQRKKEGRTNDVAAKGEPPACRELHRYKAAPEQKRVTIQKRCHAIMRKSNELKTKATPRSLLTRRNKT